MAAAEKRHAVILYAELRNFTRLSEALQADRVLELVNEFFSLAASLVTGHGGRTLSVHNDSLMGAFTQGDARESAAQAVKCAQMLQREFAPLGERWKGEYGLPAAVAVGIHPGEALFGSAGPTGMQQLVAFGDCVSIAERLVHRARAGEIVLSLDLMKALGPEVRTIGAEELPPLELVRRPALPIYGFTLDTRLDFT
ncbi:MAG TPA: adenylate/guanylate cyclase domain-containing protein [Burkholderiales bacterium]|jgi:adenylate cyclase|nr:adenylate/guanylate cyclase domain-containing protein [Burkholderiales bacterium]